MRNPLRFLTELRAPASLTRIPVRLLAPLTFLLAAGLCSLGAVWAAAVIESRSAEGIRAALQGGGIEWAEVATDGLQVTMTGTAPTEAARFRALSLAGGIVDSDRVIDAMDVADAAALKAPDFKIEVLRNDDGISLIGLIPSGEAHEKVVGDLKELIGSGTLTDMLETAEHPVPAGWEEAVDFGIKALRALPRSKISVSANEVKVTAISDSPAEKARLESDLTRKRPSGLKVVLDISAPRPVITPFTLRFLIDGEGARFDACSAESERARDRIVAAAQAAGAEGQQTCTIGLGVPTTVWADAVTMAITALKEIGAGSVTFSDADISLIAADTVPQSDFDRVVGELESNLPEVFSLNAVLTPKPDQAAETVVPEFNATLNDKGMLDLRGRLGDELSRDAVESYARARFGTASVHTATRITPDMPQGWPVRVLAALEALGELANGQAIVREDSIEIRGVTGSPQARDTVARILTSKLGEGQTYKLSVRYDPKLDPLLGLPTPEECVAQVNALLAGQKISFEPGSAQLTRESGALVDEIAVTLKGCPDAPIEIGGHTDSQGREEMNLALSEDRAEAVLAALMDRRILTANLTAIGYGETVPIAANDSEAGRETNRRIEFRLVAPAAAANAAAPGEAGAGEPVIEAQQATEDTPRPKLRPETGGTDN
ncbi:MAG: OmpA family protein [Proteobacteria bacterium]|nr:OmpA family protein [Pseudomonadota bacterium]